MRRNPSATRVVVEEAVALSLARPPRSRLAEGMRDVKGRGDLLLSTALRQAGYPDLADTLSTRLVEAKRLVSRAAALKTRIVVWKGEDYPEKLAEIFDPPVALWVKGQLAWLRQPTVAIVGSRAASQYALEIAHQLACDLATRGVAVVSGMARGVDSAAHRGALEGGGLTVAVLGCGVDVIYPREHRDLAEAIVQRGALVSEFPPGTAPLAGHFPLRNRLISGLSLAVVVVEASNRSGSLITAGCALEQGRDVMAVPGNALSDRNRGAHALLRDGACLVETAEDVLRELGLNARADAQPADRQATTDPLLRLMAVGEVYDLDALVTLSGLEGRSLLAELSELELRGFVRRTEAGQFVRPRPERGSPSPGLS